MVEDEKICDIIKEYGKNPKTFKMINIFGKNTSKKKILVSEPHASALTWYTLGKKFEDCNQAEDLKFHLEPPTATTESVDPLKNFTTYKAHFFSITQNQPTSFDVRINLKKGCPNHKQIIVETEFDGVKECYKGTGLEIKGKGKLLGVLTNKDESDGITINIDIFYKNKFNFLICIITGMTSINQEQNETIAFESILIEEGKEKEKEKELKQYVNLRRNGFVASPMIDISRKETLLNSFNIKKLNILIGTYRVWRYDDDSNIIQSVFTIDEYFNAFCTTILYDDDENHNNQACTIFPSYDSSLKVEVLKIYCRPRGEDNVLSVTMLRMPEPNFKCMQGYMLYMSEYNENYIHSKVGGICFMKESNEVTDSNSHVQIKSKIILKKDIAEEIKNNGKLIDLKDNLDEMEMAKRNPN